MVTGVSGVNFSSILLSRASMKAASTRNLADVDGDHLATLANRERNALEGRRLLGCLLQSFECLAARVELATAARNEATRLHVVDLHALLALGREAKLCLRLQPVSLGKSANVNFAVTDGDRAVRKPCPRAARCRPACSESRPWGRRRARRFASRPSQKAGCEATSLLDQVTGSPVSYWPDGSHTRKFTRSAVVVYVWSLS